MAALFLTRWLQGRFQCAGYIPPVPEAVKECALAQTQFGRPLRDGLCSFVVGHTSIMASVVHLLENSGPAYITRLVIAVIIDSVNAVLWAWSASHITKEHRERMRPFIANRDTASTVVWITSVRWDQAPRFNLGPHLIFRADFIVNDDVRAAALSGDISAQASTRSRTTTEKIFDRHVAHDSTVTPTSAHHASVVTRRWFNGRPSREFLSGFWLSASHGEAHYIKAYPALLEI